MKRTGSFTVGLTILATLGFLDLTSITLVPDHTAYAVIYSGLGLITLAGARSARRGGRRGLSAVVVSRLVSVLLGILGLFIDDVRGLDLYPLVMTTVLTLVGIKLAAKVLRQPQLSPAAPDPTRTRG
ncbi:hypothetical protein BBK14_32895 [Parafrankia soli]|uniref:Uncharacterized protein n=1 Tax=Parafrankia soli TaxID=2599596 RepID=A0A1S1R4H8_9ACTN|nr:hypothetical protein [Parafrankia soli]ABW13190.1 hypothetical protein Franean1_3797 [Frankia sp. EAN1pec]OHV39644.1 hypothetical protein BBK14_32895 [Parafrankia soli]